MLRPELTTFVVVTHGDQGHKLVEWTRHLTNWGFPVVIMHKQKDKSPCRIGGCITLSNVGKEEFAYANFILSHYDILQNDYAFVHHDLLDHAVKHEKADGLERLFQRINTLENGKYGNLGNYWVETDKANLKSPLIARLPEVYKRLFHREMPVLRSCQGAQHVVSTERIKSRSRDWWKDYLKLVVEIDNKGEDRVACGEIFCRLWEEIYNLKEDEV